MSFKQHQLNWLEKVHHLIFVQNKVFPYNGNHMKMFFAVLEVELRDSGPCTRTLLLEPCPYASVLLFLQIKSHTNFVQAGHEP
jgi:hypothetical protein